MFYRIGKGVRPLWCHVSRRGLQWSNREVPIRCHSRRSVNPWEDFFRDSSFGGRRGPWGSKNMENLWNMVDRFTQPRSFDAYYVRPRGHQFAEGTARASEVAQVKYDSKGFEVKLDVQSFAPSELKIKLAGNRLTVRAKHEQTIEDEHGFVSREFHREFNVPEDVNLESLKSSISEEGYLTIRADIIGAEKPAEKTIEINMEPKPEDAK